MRGGPQLAVLLTAGAVTCGCVTTVHPPTDPVDPVTVFLVDEGRHASLVLPDDDKLVRYAYGDWRWMAEQRHGFDDALLALFARSRAALGRQKLVTPATTDSIRAQIAVPVESLHPIVVAEASVRRLGGELDAFFRKSEAVHSDLYGLEFVPHPLGYSLGHNSNRLIGKWLRQLGCRVEGVNPLSNWRVVER